MRFQSDVDKYGPGRALELLKANAPTDAVTVSAWCRHHIDHLTGVEKGTRARYESYLDRDIAPILGDLPLTALS
ncbi:hypothetical protein ACLXNF_24105 [Mycobacteroides chelonae]|uniref:hypothetical protein n=1 Tax=Mycobacteroides chelonae TaxID=1774 RepID=UPI0039ECC77B